jgi:GNAT superfamily N-acetyltransferase
MHRMIFFRSSTCLRQLPYQNLLLIPKQIRSMASSKVIPPYTPLALKYNISIHNMTKEDLQLVFKWAEKEGWNPGKHEIEPLYAADPSGYYILKVNDEPTASLAAVRYGKFAFLGLFMVIPSRRGQGFGAMLWDTVLTNKLGICSGVGLNSVMEQIERYRKSDFSPSFLNTRWKGKPDNIPSERGIKKEGIFLTDKFSIKDLVAYDNRIFSTPRAAFLTKWLTMPESHALTALDSQGNVIGYGVISRTVEPNSYKIAPLLANSEIVTDQLYRSLCSFAGKGATVSIDIPKNSSYASGMVERFKLEKVFDTMRMYRGKEIPEIDKDKVGGFTSLEIGH